VSYHSVSSAIKVDSTTTVFSIDNHFDYTSSHVVTLKTAIQDGHVAPMPGSHLRAPETGSSRAQMLQTRLRQHQEVLEGHLHRFQRLFSSKRKHAAMRCRPDTIVGHARDKVIGIPHL
jgi:hypothetical protein